jgi:hypothetical protein
VPVGSIECPNTGTYAHAAPSQDDPEGVDRLHGSDHTTLTKFVVSCIQECGVRRVTYVKVAYQRSAKIGRVIAR